MRLIRIGSQVKVRITNIGEGADDYQAKFIADYNEHTAMRT